MFDSKKEQAWADLGQAGIFGPEQFLSQVCAAPWLLGFDSMYCVVTFMSVSHTVKCAARTSLTS